MAKDSFLIAPYNSGLQKDTKSWLIPEDAFFNLNNMYVWRSFVRKRVGSTLLIGTTPALNPQLLSRLRIEVTTIMAGAAAGNVPVGTPLNVVGQLFSIGEQIFTINNLGSPIVMLNTGAGVGTYDTATGAFTFVGIAAVNGTPVYFYPALPVMDFPVLLGLDTNFERYFAFDTRFAYEYQGAGGWQRLNLGAATWSGTDADFFSSINYRGNFQYEYFLFVTNNTFADGIRYFDGGTDTWVQYARSYSSAADTAILTCRIVIQFKNRLLFLNTLEEDGVALSQRRYQGRCRFSQQGAIGAVEAFYQPPGAYGRGGFVDAATSEQIVGAQILRDRLIVYFEQSTWELVYQNNEMAPFKWVNINIELGAESTNSIVSFDKGILAISDVGIHVTNGVNVDRIDVKIPDEVYTISNIDDGIERVTGIRDYDAELVYWSFPSTDIAFDNVYPNRLLVYNYQNDTWATFDDSITAFGYIRLNNGVIWSQLDTFPWSEWNTPWSAGQEQRRQPRVVAGNQEGFTFYMNRDLPFNAESLQITSILIVSSTINSTTLQLGIVSHNLQVGTAIRLLHVNGSGNMADLNDQIVFVTSVVTLHAVEIVAVGVIAGVYSGAGTASLVSNINLITKQYNFYLSQGVNFTINKMDILVTNTPKGTDDPTDPGGQVSIQTFPNSGSLEANNLVLTTAPYAATLYPYERFQTRLWHTVYPDLYGSFIQLAFYWNAEQLLDKRISLKTVEIHAMMFYTQITDSRLQ